MTTAVVRVADTKEFVGLFAYPTKAILFGMIDECCDPFCTEYHKVESGGFFVPYKTNKLLSLKEDKSGDHDNVHDNALISEYILDHIEKNRWQTFNNTDMDNWYYRNCRRKTNERIK